MTHLILQQKYIFIPVFFYSFHSHKLCKYIVLTTFSMLAVIVPPNSATPHLRSRLTPQLPKSPTPQLQQLRNSTIPQIRNLATSEIPNSAPDSYRNPTTQQIRNSAIKQFSNSPTSAISTSFCGALYRIMAAVILFLTVQSFQECQIFLVLNHTFLTLHSMFWDSHNSSLIPYQKQNQALFCLLPAGKFDSLNT